MRLQQVLLFVKNIDGMSAFYRDILRLTPVPEASSEGFVVLLAGGAQLALHAVPSHIARSIRIATPPREREESPAKLIFAVKSVATERKRLIARGVSMRDVSAWGACDGVDPEGNIFQITKEVPRRPRLRAS